MIHAWLTPLAYFQPLLNRFQLHKLRDICITEGSAVAASPGHQLLAHLLECCYRCLLPGWTKRGRQADYHGKPHRPHQLTEQQQANDALTAELACLLATSCDMWNLIIAQMNPYLAHKLPLLLKTAQF